MPRYSVALPGFLALGSATGQVILFICVALAVAYFTNMILGPEARYRSIFETPAGDYPL